MSDMTPEQMERTLRQRAAYRMAVSQHVEKKSLGGGSMLKVLADENTAMADTVRRMRELIDTAAVWARDGYVPADESAVDDFLAKVDTLTEQPHAD